MTKKIKKLLKLPKRTNNERMKLTLGIPDLYTYLISRLLKLKIKYDILYNNLKNIGNNFEYYIHEDFRRRLYTW